MPRRNRFAYQPALDGVRAVAVAMVLVFHGGFGWMTGGYVGVSVFFTLSGYLITSLALVEHDETGRLDVRSFYARRVRRLMPASLLCLVAVIALAAAGVFAGVEHLRRDVWAAVVPVYNWVSLAGGKSYSELVAGVGEPASPLDHYWSLAIEEQFYWVWPLALIGVLRLHRPGRLVVVGGLVAAGAAAALVIHEVWGPDAAYWATPARLGEILVGALLAVLLHGRAGDGGGLPRAVRWLAPTGLAVIAWAAVTWPAGSGPAYSGWLPVFSLASAALIAGLQIDSPTRRLLSVRPLVLAGVISYGVYLFHWPVYAVLDRERTGLDGATLFAVRVGMTIAIAALSFVLFERPVQRAHNLGWRPVGAVTLGAGTAVVLLAATLPTERPAYWEVSAAGVDEVALAPTGSVAPVALVAPPAPAPLPAATTVAPVPRPRVETSPAATTTTTTTTTTTAAALAKPSRPVRILVVGDSTASATGQGLVAWAAEHDDLALVSVRWAPAFGFLRHGERPGLDADFAATSEELDRGLHDELVRLRPDVVVLMSTIADIEDRVFDDVGALAPTSGEFRARMAADYVAFVDRLVAAGVPRVAWVVPPQPLVPWSGELAELADPARWATLRQAIEHARTRRPDVVTIVDLAGWEARHPADDRRPDGLHYSVEAATAIAGRFLAPTADRRRALVSARPATGLVVGRFDPPHLGHSYLIREAAARCDRLAVFVNSGPRDRAPGSLRAGWLADLHPDVVVVEVVHDLPTDFGDEALWQRWIELFRSRWPYERGPDVVYSSDPYVDELARRLGAEPVVVDADRVTVPISATMVRENPAAHLDRLAPPVRAWVEDNWL